MSPDSIIIILWTTVGTMTACLLACWTWFILRIVGQIDDLTKRMVAVESCCEPVPRTKK